LDGFDIHSKCNNRSLVKHCSKQAQPSKRMWGTFYTMGTLKRARQGPSCKANATIDSLLESNALKSLTYVPLNHDLLMMPSPILSPRDQVHLSSRNGEHLDDVAINMTIDGKDIVSKHIC